MNTHEYWLFILAIPVACISWTVTKEEVFREIREYFVEKSKTASHILKRKLFYMLTCEYCFSHYVTLFLLVLTKYRLLYPGFTGYLISGFSIVWVANIYMSLYNLIRVDLKKEKIIAQKEADSVKESYEVRDQT